ncbi:MAG: FAD-dependent monooxygenase [Burkholderiales bacterium]|nr:FAD-dependent monooxygenase [Burkholderiales bacterium]
MTSLDLPLHIAGLTPGLAPIPAADPPTRCDVLVVGAGPAGSACARALALAGIDVVLVDQHEFPRDKICGDGLIPDAHAALRELGVYDEVMDQAHRVSHVGCIAPRGGRVDVPGQLAVLPRRRLDHLLVRAAQRAGAHLATPWRFGAPIEEGGRVVGGKLIRGQRDGGAAQVIDVQARWVVLATGAGMQAMVGASLCERRAPSGLALRTYVHHTHLPQAIQAMEVVWHRRLSPGYGWVFPCGGDVYNVGVGVFDSQRREREAPQRHPPDTNLRHLFDAFAACHASAGELLQGGTQLGDAGLKGAPLRCTLTGAKLGRPGLLATGEAIGSTYDFTGEGIGKALQTGLLAARVLLEARRGVAAAGSARSPASGLADGSRSPAGHSAGTADTPATDAAVLARYGAAINALRPQFELYAKANRVNSQPWLADLVIWRARRSERLRRRMTGVLEETTNPGHLLTLQGLWKLMMQ